jgi:hypothetical protein
MLTASIACGQTDLTIAADAPAGIHLTWKNGVVGDAALKQVFDVERRQSLTLGDWDKIASLNLTGTYTDSTPPDQSAFYRLRESEFPLALSGPDAESASQGLRIVSPSGPDVIFLKSHEPAVTRSFLEATNTLTVAIDGAYRSTILFASYREGLDFRYLTPGGKPSETLDFTGGQVDLLSFSDGDLRLATLELLAALSAVHEGARVAANEVTSLLTHFPDSATVWQNIGGPATNEATVLYYRARSQDQAVGASPADFGDEVAFFAKPLVSGASAVPLSKIAESLPAAGGEVVNLNAVDPDTAEPWIGARSSALNDHPITAAKWIYIGAGGSATNASNPAVARYAYWIEDESFRVNPAFVAAGAIDTNSMTPAEIRFLITTNSAGLDLSRGGFKRFNINSLIGASSSPTDAGNIRSNINRITAVITNSNASPLFGQRFYRPIDSTAESINSTNLVGESHARIYLQKIAANIVDYLDQDDQPTIINNDANFSLLVGNSDYGFQSLRNGSNSIAAMGVEGVPRLQEYALHARIRKMRHTSSIPDSFGFSATSNPNPASAEYEVSIDHYFEFWNPSTKDVRLTNAFLKIHGQPAFGPGVSGALGSVDRETSKIPIGNVVFPAGRVTVLTTSPTGELSVGSSALGFGVVSSNVLTNVVSLSCPHHDRVFTGTTTSVAARSYQVLPVGNSSPFFNYDRLFQVPLATRSTGNMDFKSTVLVGNSLGILESFTGLLITNLNLCVSSSYIWDTLSHRPGAGFAAGHNDFVRVSRLEGNFPVSSAGEPTGDPRALNEQLNHYSDSSNMSLQTRFVAAALTNSNMGSPNYSSVDPAMWSDFTTVESGARKAPLVVRNSAMTSIGELGHITDPARPDLTGLRTRSKGGGRTLRVGQSEMTNWHDGQQNQPSRTWTSWRLTDLFSTKTNLHALGSVNPNSILRDDGRAFAALFAGFRFAPAGSEGAEGVGSRGLLTHSIISGLVGRLTNEVVGGFPIGSLNIFWERGEVSELSLFNSGTSLVGSVNMSNVIDRGREEVVRRTIEQITTRGSVFTAYVVAQSMSGTNTADTIRLKQTFRVEPQFAAGAFDDAFNASNPGSVAARFSPPTNFSSEVIFEELTSVEAP